jgi:hypothetical protein
VLVKNVTTSPQAAFAGGEGLSRAELEQQVFVNLLGQNAELREQSELWAATALSIKRMALSRTAPDAILDELTATMEKAK